MQIPSEQQGGLKRLPQAVTLRDLLELSHITCEKFVENIHRAAPPNSSSLDKPAREPTPHSTFLPMPSSITILHLGIAFSIHLLSSFKPYGHYGYLFDMISYFSSHISRLLMDSILI
jgi:hypothetical protein